MSFLCASYGSIRIPGIHRYPLSRLLSAVPLWTTRISGVEALVPLQGKDHLQIFTLVPVIQEAVVTDLLETGREYQCRRKVCPGKRRCRWWNKL